jgi:hypothetical protein
MVNATQMAKPFGKMTHEFLRRKSTKDFIKSWNETNKSYGKSPQLLVDTQSGGRTFMHRALALKFAAWLSPDFDVWVFKTIDRLLFGNTTRRISLVKKKDELKAKRKELETRLLKNTDMGRELASIDSEIKAIDKKLKGFDQSLFGEV